jgi:hypothetical protein
MTVDVNSFEKELKELICKYGFTRETKVTDEILTLYLITCMRQYITNFHVEGHPCWCKDWLKI